MKRLRIHGQSLANFSPAERDEFIEWAKHAQKRTTFDPEIIGHPRCAVLFTEDDEEKLAYLVVQTVLMAEVALFKPGLSDRLKAYSLGSFDKALMTIGKDGRYGDVYCYVPETEADYAAKIQRHGWTEVEGVRLFKKSTGVNLGRR